MKLRVNLLPPLASAGGGVAPGTGGNVTGVGGGGVSQKKPV